MASEIRTISAFAVGLVYVRSLRSFLTLNNFELHRVAFLQAFVAFGIYGAVMNENVRSVVSSNEPVSFSVVKPLHSTFQTIHVRPLECVNDNTHSEFAVIVRPVTTTVKRKEIYSGEREHLFSLTVAGTGLALQPQYSGNSLGVLDLSPHDHGDRQRERN